MGNESEENEKLRKMCINLKINHKNIKKYKILENFKNREKWKQKNKNLVKLCEDPENRKKLKNQKTLTRVKIKY